MKIDIDKDDLIEILKAHFDEAVKDPMIAETICSILNSIYRDEDWIDMDVEGNDPPLGDKVRVLKQMEFEGVWNGEDFILAQNELFRAIRKTFWKMP